METKVTEEQCVGLQPWNIYEDGRYCDTQWFGKGLSHEDVRLLVMGYGYNAPIVVRAREDQNAN